jgi:enoyl-CoA hydratase/carnithine racemase
VLRILLTGEQFSAQRAFEFGLVSHVSEGDLDEYTAALATDIAMAAGTTLFLGKRGYYGQMDMGIVEAYDFAGKVMAGNFCMRDSKEGVSAFFEKRIPKWD